VTARIPDGRPLVGQWVRLDVRTPDDDEALFAVLDDPRVWESGYGGGPAGRPRDPDALVGILDSSWLAAGLPRAQYVVRTLTDDRIVGTSTLGDVVVANERGHIGSTAFAPDVWGTAVNPEAKLLMLAHAFDDCGLERVKLQTDAGLNLHSQAAIRKLGAQFEGVLRHHMKRPDGSWRDTAVFSILRAEWPDVRRGLQSRIGASGS
jgi:RimJ/RimL family protein N-acetyltransferase